MEDSDWLRAHGNDLIPVRLIDLMSVIARMEQVSRDPEFETDGIVHERIFTCDLPRLRAYLPDTALEIIEGDQ